MAFSTGGGIGTITFLSTLNGEGVDFSEDLTLTAGTGNIDFDAAVGGVVDLGDVVIASALDVTADFGFNADTITQQNGSGTTTFTGAVVLEGAGGMNLGSVTALNNVTINGGVDTLTAAAGGGVTVNLNGTLTLGDTGGAADTAVDLNLDGVFSQTTGTGAAVNLSGDITTTGDNIGFADDVTLAGAVALNTGVGAGTITFADTLNGTTDFTEDLQFTAGMGNIDFDAAVGGVVDLGDVVIASALDVTADFGFNADTITQTAGTGDTQFDGAVMLNGAGGLVLTTNTVTLNGTVNTLTGGPVTITNGGLLDIAAGADMSLDGAFTQNGAGAVQTAGDITTTGDDISFASAVTLTGDIALDSANGNIAFSSTVNGPHILDLSAGTGTVTMDAQIGGTTALTYMLLRSCSSLTTTVVGALINLQNVDLYIDAPGSTIVLQRDLTADNIYFYRGTLDINGHTLATTAAGGGDLAVFGAAYNADDVDRGAASNEFAYPDAAGLVYYPNNGTYTAATGVFSTAPSAAFTDGATFDLTGATISVGGNFYNNGADMEGDAAGADNTWTLNVQDSGTSDPVSNPPFGTPYAVAFNMRVSYSLVGGGNIAAAEPVDRAPAGPSPEDESHNKVTNGLNNQEYDHTIPQVGWDFDAPYIVSAEIVKDDTIRITFSEPMENSSDEISAMAAAAYTDHTGNGTNTSFIANTALVDNSDGTPDAIPFNFTSADDEDDLTTFYLRANGITWTTDADGTHSSVSGSGTDAAGVADTGTIPDISWLKGNFWDAGGKNPVWNYTENGKDTYTATTDECGPVLYEIVYGRAAHNQPATTMYDGHNYFHLYWSEPVDIGSGAAFSAATPTAENIRSEVSPAGPLGIGGDIRDDGGDVLVDGYFRYDDVLSVGPLDRGWRTGSTPANALYRADTDGDITEQPFTNNDQELRIYLSGFLDGGVEGSDLFPGWHSDVPLINDASGVDVVQNTNIVDVSGNQIDYMIDNPAITADPQGSAPDVVDDWINSWDVDPPAFSSYTVSFADDPNVTTSYEIISRATTATQMINRLEFHVLDNSALDYSNASDPGLNPQGDGVWDPQDVNMTGGSDLTHPDTRLNEGIRDLSFAYPGDSYTEYESFTVEEVGNTPLINTYNTGFDTAVGDIALYNDVLPDNNDSYFTLTMQDTGHSWGLLSELYISYDYTGAYITDLAGNILPSTLVPIAAIERTPPEINLSLCSVGGDRVYLTFSEPVWGNDIKSEDVDHTDFIITGNAPTNFKVLERSPEGAGAIQGAIEGYLTLTTPLTADQALSLTIEPAGAGLIFDKAENSMLATAEHRITDVGIGIAEPVWASDGVHQDDVYGSGSTALRDFTGAEGSKLMDRDITLEASILAPGYTWLPSQLYFDVSPSDTVTTDNGFWLPAFVSIELPPPNTDARGLNPERSQGAVRDFLIPGSDSEISSGADIEFVLKVGNLFAARATDPDDPRTLAPWVIPIRDIRRQVGGVTILNNVINPTEGGKTILVYELEAPGMVTAQVFSLSGDVVNILFRGRQGAGEYTYTWDGTNRSGMTVARGVYFIRVVGPGIDEYRKVMVVK